MFPYVSEAENKLKLTLAENSTQYVQTAISMGIVAGRITPTLVDEAAGRSSVGALHYTGTSFESLAKTRDALKAEAAAGASTELPAGGNLVLSSAAKSDAVAPSVVVVASSVKVNRRRLTGNDLEKHFAGGSQASGRTTQSGQVDFLFSRDGTLSLNNRKNGNHVSGIWEIKHSDDQVSMRVSSAKFKSVTGCYKFFQESAATFELRSVTDACTVHYSPN